MLAAITKIPMSVEVGKRGRELIMDEIESVLRALSRKNGLKDIKDLFCWLLVGKTIRVPPR